MANEDLSADLHYKYTRYLSAFEVWKLLNLEVEDGEEHIIADLEIGFVRICAVACVHGVQTSTCFDVYIKDSPTATEYVFYGSIYEWIDYVGSDMEDLLRKKLSAYLDKHGLSFAECNFPRKPGYSSKK